jgi:hypothetical protein
MTIYFSLTSPAQAGDPVITALGDKLPAGHGTDNPHQRRLLGAPLEAGHDDLFFFDEILTLAAFEVALSAQGREIDAREASDGHKVEREISHQAYLRRAILVLDGVQVAAIAIEWHAELGTAAGVGELDMHHAALDRILHVLARFLALARFDRMLACAEKIHQLAHFTSLS